MTPRRRLTPDARRAELVDIASRQFADRPYDEVGMDEIAVHAGVSRALLYRYFPTKAALFAAVYRMAADRLLDVTTLDHAQPLAPQVAAGLDAHIDYFLANRQAVLTANRVLAGDPTIQAIISDELAVLRDRVLATQDLDDASRRALSTILMGWLTFVRVLCVEWLTVPAFSRETLRDVCVEALFGALGPLAVRDSGPEAGLGRPPTVGS